MAIKPKKTTCAELERKVFELEAQLVHQPHFADANIHKASTERLMGSGVILQLTALGGRKIVDPVLIKDGLSPATIESIKADLRRTYDLLVMFKPQAAKTVLNEKE